MEFELKTTNPATAENSPNTIGGAVQHFKELYAGAGTDIFKVNADGIFAGADAFADAPFKLTYKGALTASNLIIAGGTITGTTITGGTITGTTITGGTLRTVAPGAGTGSAVVLTGGVNEMIHLFYNATEVSTIKGYTTEGAEQTYMALTAASGRTIKLKDSMIEIDGDLMSHLDNDGNIGTGSKQWHEIHGRTLYQSNNTDGSRSVYDEAYIEVNLFPKKLLKKRKSSKEVMMNGYVEGLELPYKRGTVFKWTKRGLAESTKEDDFVVAVASDKGLPIVLGAEPVRIIGKAKIGDCVVPSNKKGCAMAVNKKDLNGQEMIGRCLEIKRDNKEGLIKVMIKF